MNTSIAIRLMGTAGVAACLFACSSKGADTTASATTGATTTTTTTTSASTTSGAGGMTSSTSGAGGMMGTGGVMGTGGMMGTGGTGGGASLDVNGCTFATAEDKTKMTKSIVIPKWTFGHQYCVKVHEGTLIMWQSEQGETLGGNVATHPVFGGVSPDKDEKSVISTTKPSSDTNLTVQAPIGIKQVVPLSYFCGKHVSMKGVVYVVPN